MNVLVLNAGSSSVKFRLVDADTGLTLLDGAIGRLGEGRSHADAFAEILAGMHGQRVDAVGHRVVHGGASCSAPTLVDDAALALIEALCPLAPLHNPHNLAGLVAARAALPDVPHVAVFDTAFHATIPPHAHTYAIDQAVAERFGLRRYGFHGTSHGYVATLAAAALGRPLDALRIVSLHLGNGASACAIERGRSVDTSMGMTPLDGLVMGTRGGELDPGVLLLLLRAGMSVDELDGLLQTRSGLAGLSGRGGDLRDIEAQADLGDARAKLALGVFAHRVRKYIGAYAAAMGGLDAVVFTGGIGENAPAMRRRVLERLEFLGLVIDDARNAAAAVTDAAPVAAIAAPGSRVAALVVKTNEELAIARAAALVVLGH